MHVIQNSQVSNGSQRKAKNSNGFHGKSKKPIDFNETLIHRPQTPIPPRLGAKGAKPIEGDVVFRPIHVIHNDLGYRVNNRYNRPTLVIAVVWPIITIVQRWLLEYNWNTIIIVEVVE